MKSLKLKATEKEILDIIKHTKRTYKFCIPIVLIVFYLVGWLSMMCTWSDTAWNWMCKWFFWLLAILWGFILFVIQQISYISLTIKIYKILIKSEISGLSIKNIEWVKWGWLCPIANLYKPYQILRDIYKYTNLSVWKKYNAILLYVWRFSLILTILLGFSSFFLFRIFLIVSYSVFIFILYDLTKLYDIYLKKI